MMRLIATMLFAALLAAGSAQAAIQDLPQSPVAPQGTPSLKYPRIVLYSTSWCPHCKAAKEYFTRNNIPFINRDVELDSDAMKTLTEKYQSQGVPVIVIGNDEVILKGFSETRFEKAVEKVRKK